MTLAVLLGLASIGLGHYMMPVDALAPADAIIVVSGGSGERVEKGIELMQNGYADYLVFSGDAFDVASTSNAEVMKMWAIREGIAESNILTDSQSRTTYENAYYVRQLLNENGLKEPSTLILVTSSYHQRRLYQNFREIYKDLPSVTFINQPAEVSFWSENSWFLHKKGIDLTVREAIKIFWGEMTGHFSG